MKTVMIIGLDIAKSVFQVRGIDAEGKAVIRKQLKRARVIPFFMKLPPCVIGIESCASSHHWARELTALEHEVKLMPPAYVKPYVSSGRRTMPRTPRQSARRHSGPAHADKAICGFSRFVQVLLAFTMNFLHSCEYFRNE